MYFILKSFFVRKVCEIVSTVKNFDPLQLIKAFINDLIKFVNCVVSNSAIELVVLKRDNGNITTMVPTRLLTMALYIAGDHSSSFF